MTFYYMAVNHCNGITWSAQIKARNIDHARSLLRSIHGAGLQIIYLREEA